MARKPRQRVEWKANAGITTGGDSTPSVNNSVVLPWSVFEEYSSPTIRRVVGQLDARPNQQDAGGLVFGSAVVRFGLICVHAGDTPNVFDDGERDWLITGQGIFYRPGFDMPVWNGSVVTTARYGANPSTFHRELDARVNRKLRHGCDLVFSTHVVQDVTDWVIAPKYYWHFRVLVGD